MIKIFDASQIKEIDKCTIANQGILSVDLMERASLAIFDELEHLLEPKQKIVVLVGQGNNGGDAFVLARLLMAGDYHIRVYFVDSGRNLSDDCRTNKERLERLITVHTIKSVSDIPAFSPDVLVIDGLLGTGVNRPAEGLLADVIKAVNNSEAKVCSIDMPSGLYVEDNTDNDRESIVKSDFVFSFQFPKLALLLPQDKAYYRKMFILDIELCNKCLDSLNTDYYFIEKKDVSKLVYPRETFSHKGTYGHALLIAGSYGKIGAAVLAARACLKAGVGLLTVHLPKCGVDIMQSSVPEAMVDVDLNAVFISELNMSDLNKYTLGVGPAIGQSRETKDFLHVLLGRYNKPMVLDADALNLIASDDLLKRKIPEGSILTPHPVEFDRLVGGDSGSSYQRLQNARSFAEKYKVYIVLKGAYSAIVTPDKTVYFNSTGNPGMATGGSGDALAGIITSLLAQKYSSLDAALLGVYLHGLAGDLAAKSKYERSMLPSDIIEYLGRAYRSLEK